MAKVSVIIPFYNCKYVDQAIDSVLKQTFSDIEIILVDDGSTLYTEKLFPYLDRIHCIRQMNGGTACALNRGLQTVNGEYVAWLSSDDLFYPDKIKRQVEFMEQRNAAFCYTDYHVINERGQIIQHDATAKFRTFRSFIEAFTNYCPINGCTVMMKSSILKQIGYFNETLIYTHDYDFWVRLLLEKENMYYMNEPLTAYRWHEAMGTIQHLESIQIELAKVKANYFNQFQGLLANY